MAHREGWGRVERLYGPPGTGKTTTLTKLIAEQMHVRGADAILAASFSVTAAQEIAGRGTGLPKSQVGTLHSHAYKVLGHSHVARDPRMIKDWNDSNDPQWRISADSRGRASDTGGDEAADDTRAIVGGRTKAVQAEASQASSGDELITALDRLRSMCVPRDAWPPNVVRFAEAWEAWKRASDAVDYTDMIDGALDAARDGEPAPGSPELLIVDEAQDLTPLELRLAQRWARLTELTIFAGDDDQAINTWRGSDPTALLRIGGEAAAPTDDEFVIGEVADTVLEQSYRIPLAVHRAAERWVRRLGQRRDKVYHPRQAVHADEDVVGRAIVSGHRLDAPALADEIGEEIASTVGASEQDHPRVMVLASCGYMLAGLLSNLRDRGIPIHNPYRPTEGAWNPLSPARGLSTAERVYRYLVMDDRALGMTRSRLWTGEDIRAWAGLVKTSTAGMVKGATKLIEELPPGEVDPSIVARLFKTPEALEAATGPDVDWLADHMLAAKAKTATAAYALSIARQRGPAGLVDTPPVVTGTVHSVKGAQADIVYVCPDISSAAASQVATPSGRDAMIRLFYVAMTRARQEVRVLRPSNRLHVSPFELLPAEVATQ